MEGKTKANCKIITQNLNYNLQTQILLNFGLTYLLLLLVVAHERFSDSSGAFSCSFLSKFSGLYNLPKLLDTCLTVFN